MDGFAQRFAEQLHVCGPPSWRYLFVTEHDIAQARQHAQHDGEARRLLQAVVHPDTQQPIPLLFRMAAHVPVNTVLLLAMLTASSPVTVAASQLANQSFNAAQFYANRNASNSVSNAQLAASYIGAVCASVGVGVGLFRTFSASNFLRSSLPAVPFLAAAAGKPLQIGLMRSDELTTGVRVYDESGRCHGSSVIAGRAAVGMTIATRTIYLLPMLYLPPLQKGLEARIPALRASRWAGMASYTALTALSSAYVTPLCMAIFDQRASMRVTALEEGFRGLRDAEGRPVERLYFNKGL